MRHLTLKVSLPEYEFVYQSAEEAGLSLANYLRKRFGFDIVKASKPTRRLNQEKVNRHLHLLVTNPQYVRFWNRAVKAKLSLSDMMRRCLGLPFAKKYKMPPMTINPEKFALARHKLTA